MLLWRHPETRTTANMCGNGKVILMTVSDKKKVENGRPCGRGRKRRRTEQTVIHYNSKHHVPSQVADLGISCIFQMIKKAISPQDIYSHNTMDLETFEGLEESKDGYQAISDDGPPVKENIEVFRIQDNSMVHVQQENDDTHVFDEGDDTASENFHVIENKDKRMIRMASMRLRFPVDLERMADDPENEDHASFEPDTFAGVLFMFGTSKVSVYRSGNVIFYNIKNDEKLKELAKRIARTCAKFKTVPTRIPTTKDVPKPTELFGKRPFGSSMLSSPHNQCPLRW